RCRPVDTRMTRPAVRSRARWVDRRGCARPSRDARSLTVPSPSRRAFRMARRDGSLRAPATRAASCIARLTEVVYQALHISLSGDVWRRRMTRERRPTSDPAALGHSRARLMAAAASGRVGHEALARAAAFRTIAAWTLAPAPRDPREHVHVAHAQARPYLVFYTPEEAAAEVMELEEELI